MGDFIFRPHGPALVAAALLLPVTLRSRLSRPLCPPPQVSSSSFLSAAQTRWRRGSTRKQALVHMRELLTAAVRVGGVTHLVGPVTMVLQGGPR
jgi:hypothetical protein